MNTIKSGQLVIKREARCLGLTKEIGEFWRRDTKIGLWDCSERVLDIDTVPANNFEMGREGHVKSSRTYHNVNFVLISRFINYAIFSELDYRFVHNVDIVLLQGLKIARTWCHPAATKVKGRNHLLGQFRILSKLFVHDVCDQIARYLLIFAGPMHLELFSLLLLKVMGGPPYECEAFVKFSFDISAILCVLLRFVRELVDLFFRVYIMVSTRTKRYW